MLRIFYSNTTTHVYSDLNVCKLLERAILPLRMKITQSLKKYVHRKEIVIPLIPRKVILGSINR